METVESRETYTFNVTKNSPEAKSVMANHDLDSKKVREDFPIFNERPQLVYLDNAATTQKPETVIKAVEEFYRKNNANIGRGLYDLASDATEAYRQARENIADFINADSDEIIFVRNTTEAENLVASSLEFEGNVVLSKMAHHSEQLPWREKARDEEKQISYLETENGKISIESAKEKINENTGLVAISHISNVFGAENPVEEIIDIAHEKDALVVLDVAQSIPHTRLDVKELDADFVTFSGHKMLGPTGIGVLYGRKKLLNDMEPYQVGGGMIDSVTEEEIKYSDVPEKFEAGTPNIAGAVGLSKAVDYLENTEMDKIRDHTEEVADKIRRGLEGIDEIEVISPEGANIVSFKCSCAHPHDVAEVLNQHGVAVRAGHHCAQPQMMELDVNGVTRASPYIYNTEEDVEKFLEGVKDAVETFNTIDE